MIAILFLLLQLKVPDAAQFVGGPQGTAITGKRLELRTNEVSALLRCPVCQGMAVADSKAEMAVNMKAQVRELLERGYTEGQILKYFELSYGQFVLLEPKFEGFTSLVWLLPVIALAIGAVVVFFKLRRLEKPLPGTQQPSNPPTQASGNPATETDEYITRVRDLVGKGQP